MNKKTSRKLRKTDSSSKMDEEEKNLKSARLSSLSSSWTWPSDEELFQDNESFDSDSDSENNVPPDFIKILLQSPSSLSSTEALKVLEKISGETKLDKTFAKNSRT